MTEDKDDDQEETREPFTSIVVYFATLEDLDEFQELIGQRVPTSSDADKLRSFWFKP